MFGKSNLISGGEELQWASGTTTTTINDIIYTVSNISFKPTILYIEVNTVYDDGWGQGSGTGILFEVTSPTTISKNNTDMRIENYNVNIGNHVALEILNNGFRLNIFGQYSEGDYSGALLLSTVTWNVFG